MIEKRENIYRVGVLIFCFLLASCNVSDERDLCCDTEDSVVRFRYWYKNEDRFTEYIKTERYFLFDSEGRYLQEMNHLDCCPKRVSIEQLAAGTYTMVCVGNLVDYGTLEGYEEKGLEGFHLKINQYYDEQQTAFVSGDRIYWGECHFTKVGGIRQEFVGEMSNEHCVLRLRVEWERLPEFADGYYYHLDGIGTGMELYDTNASKIGVHSFPPVMDYGGRLIEEVPLRQMVLESTLTMLRWGANALPRFQLYHYDTPVSKVVDFEEVFREWKWYPENAEVQEYEIRLLILKSGNIKVYKRIEAQVGDWEDGGTFGVTT